MNFREIVQQELSRSRDTQAVQGYIPPGGINWLNRSATVHIPPTSFALEPNADGGSFLKFDGVPLPASPAGVLDAVASYVLGKEIGVMGGFRGGSLTHPYIASYTQPVYQLREREEQKLGPSRNGSIQNRFLTPLAPAGPGVPLQPLNPDPGFVGPPASASPAAREKAAARASGIQRSGRPLLDQFQKLRGLFRAE